MITSRLYSSVVSVRPDSCAGPTLSSCTICRNEPFSFQLAYRITDGSAAALPFYARVDSELPVNLYYAACVPVIHADFPPLSPRQSPGLYPDILIPKAVNPPLTKVKTWGSERCYEAGEKTALFAYNDSWQALWFAVNEDGADVAPGQYRVGITLYSRGMEKVGTNELTVEVLDLTLPEQSLIYTNWFHYDCLADMYGVPLFSERYLEIMRDFVRKAVRNGMNMLLLPAFTPPLDTPVGMERMTVQLVGVKADGDGYTFDFSLLKRFLDLCREDGVRYFEHSHFFSQWGAEHAPKVMGERDGETVQLFGWDTDAAGDEYIGFLRAYLTALRPFLKAEGLEDRVLFHISDEPGPRSIGQYSLLYGKLADLLEGCMVGDALSDPKFYESGAVRLPIASTPHVHQFLGKGGHIWAYYTGAAVADGMSNRIIQMPPERNRSLGYQLWYNRIEGFLHWGYNFWYGELCFGQIEPFLTPCGGYPNAGTSYCVYPARDGTAWQSVRQKVFAEGLTDMRALALLESLAGRRVCEDLVERHFGKADFYSSAESPESFLAFRSELSGALRAFRKKL